MHLVNFMITFLIVTLDMFGFSAIGISRRPKKFYHSTIVFLYSLAIKAVFVLVYTKEIFDDYMANKFDLKNAVKLYSYMNIVAAIINYISALMHANAMLRFLNETKLFETIAYFGISKELFKSSMWRVMVKAVLFPLAIEIMLVVRQIRNEPERHLLWTLYTVFPSLISSVLPNCFFATLVMCHQLIGALNLRLLDICKEVNCMQTELQMQQQKPYYRMQRFCDLADKIDSLAKMYSLICAEGSEYIQQLAMPFVCSLLCNLFGITAGFFTQYLALADTLINAEPYDVFNALTNAIFLVISFSEITLQAYICNDNLEAVRDTGLILQRISLVHADIRFRQSVEAFSLLVFVTKYKIQPMGLLEVNVSLVHDVLSAVTSFLLILIQTDLTLRFSLK